MRPVTLPPNHIAARQDKGTAMPLLSKTCVAGVLVLVVGAGVSRATLVDYQTQVTSVGTPPASTHFSTVSGTAPISVDVGALSGDRTFEFIVNAGLGGMSSAFMGGRTAGGQGLKFEQWQDTGVLGVTDFGVVDLNSDVPSPVNVDTYVAFVSDGVNTDLYVNGVNEHTFSGTALTITGLQGLAGVLEPAGGYSDVLDGNIVSFASYDAALTPAEVATHAAAFALVPEPGSVGLVALAALGVLGRRRRA